MHLSDAFLSSLVKQEKKLSTLKRKAVKFSGERRCYKIAFSENRNDNFLGIVWYVSYHLCLEHILPFKLFC